MGIKNKIGTPVEGMDFYGREKELEQAKVLLDRGNSLLLAAPRRIGKTSFAKKLIEEYKLQNWKCVYLDLEEIHSEEGLLKVLVDSLQNIKALKSASLHLSQLFQKVDHIKLGPISMDTNGKKDIEDTYIRLKESIDIEYSTLIVVDELTLFLSYLYNETGSLAKIKHILNWLRSLRQLSESKIRWLFCGSVGLRNFTSLYNLGYTVNDLVDFQLAEMSNQEAFGLLEELSLSEGVALNKECITYVLDKIHWNIPYFLQIVFSKLMLKGNKTITYEDIDQAYDLLCGESYLSTWSERLIEYKQNEPYARLILNSLASRKEGLSRSLLLNLVMTGKNEEQLVMMDDLLGKILSMLENDGYILNQNGIRIFRSPFLRDYWKKNLA